MNNAPERIWAHCFNTPEHGGWDQWGGYARPNNRHPLDEKEIATGAEYIRLDLHEAEVARLRADLRHVIDERDRTFALMLARAEKAEAELDALCADELVNSLYAIRDAHPTGESYSHMTDGTWREAFRDLQRLARVTLASYRARIGKGE